MLISNSSKFIYIHIHKCAGSSVEVALNSTMKWNDLLLGTTDDGEKLAKIYDSRFGLSKHVSACQIRDVVGAEVWEQYYTFSTVRHPFRRVVSIFNYIASIAEPIITDGHISMPTSGVQSWLDSTEFPPESPLSWPAVQAYLIARQANRSFSTFIRHPAILSHDVAFETQHSRLADQYGNIIVDGAFCVEKLDETWPEICRKIGVPTMPLARENVTNRRFSVPAHELLRDSGDRLFIHERFQVDFEAFGYNPSNFQTG